MKQQAQVYPTGRRRDDDLSDSTIGLLKVAAEKRTTDIIRVRLLIAIPVVMVLLLVIMAAIFYWLVEAYFGRTSSNSQVQSVDMEEFARDWLVLLTAFVIGGAMLGFALAYSITSPIRAIIRLSEKIAGGDLKHKLSIARMDEVGQLGSSFNNMLDSLNEFIATRNRFIVESFSGGLLTTDLNGTVTAINSASEKLLDINAESAAGMPAVRVFAQPGFEELAAFYEEAAWKKESLVGRELTTSLNGRRQRLSVNATPMKDRAGTVFGLIFNFRDLEEIQRFHEQMKRTDRLATMGTFATGLAHEVRNPLGAIKGTAQLLAEDVRSMPRAAEYANVIVKEVNRLDTLVREVQAYSQPAADKEPGDLVQVMKDTVALARNSPKNLLKPGVKIQEQYEPLPVIQMSQDKITQAVLNILLNAFQAAPENGLVEIQTQYVPGERLGVQVIIANNGPPIPADQIEHIFEPFYTTKPTGSGLGLSIAYQVVAHHGGDISVSNLDHRVAFIIRLPAS